MLDHATDVRRPRAELIRQRSLRSAWIFVAIGLLIPVVALLGACIGWSWRRTEGGGHLPLIAIGVTIFVVRLVLWLTVLP
jgi:hypothetical protein